MRDHEPTITQVPAAPQTDAAKPDAGKPDAGKPDAGKPDAGKPEAGKPAVGDAKKPKPIPMLMVRGPQAGRWRAGRKFGAEPVSIPLSELSDDQRAALEGDPALICVLTE